MEKVMELHGTPQDEDIAEEITGLRRLREVTLVLSRNDMEALGRFVEMCFQDSGKNPHWDHEHFIDFSAKHSDGPDVIIYRTGID